MIPASPPASRLRHHAHTATPPCVGHRSRAERSSPFQEQCPSSSRGGTRSHPTANREDRPMPFVPTASSATEVKPMPIAEDHHGQPTRGRGFNFEVQRRRVTSAPRASSSAMLAGAHVRSRSHGASRPTSPSTTKTSGEDFVSARVRMHAARYSPVRAGHVNASMHEQNSRTRSTEIQSPSARSAGFFPRPVPRTRFRVGSPSRMNGNQPRQPVARAPLHPHALGPFPPARNEKTPFGTDHEENRDTELGQTSHKILEEHQQPGTAGRR